MGTINRLVDLVISIQDPKAIEPWSLELEHGKHALPLSPEVLEWRVFSSQSMANNQGDDILERISRTGTEIFTYSAASVNGPDLICVILSKLHHTVYDKLPHLIHELDKEFEEAVDAGMVYENIIMLRARDGRIKITKSFLEMFNTMFQRIQAESAQKQATIGMYLEELVKTTIPTVRKLTSAVVDGLWESQLEALRRGESRLVDAIREIPGKIHNEEIKKMQKMTDLLRDVDRFREDLDKLYARSNAQLREWGRMF